MSKVIRRALNVNRSIVLVVCVNISSVERKNTGLPTQNQSVRAI